jgi:FKBP-type peptidyl-prolyl cis-trans isomerase (trigger factor)
VSAQEIQAIREEMYRQLYLQAQGRSSAATPSAQSGYSKELDMAPARDVLRALGDMLRNHMRAVIEDVAAARGDQVTVDIRGFEFAEGDDPDQIKAAQAALELGIPSPTLEREIQKRIARYLLRDANQSVIQAVEAEIDAAPTREERQAAAEEAARRRIAESFGAFAVGASDQGREPAVSEGGAVAGVVGRGFAD